jgi:hypothetical protein
MPILPETAIPPPPAVFATLTADLDFDRHGSCNGPPLYPQRRHFAAHNAHGRAPDVPLCDRKAPAAFEPEYPRVSQTRRAAAPDAFAEERTRGIRGGLRGFPALINVESMRAPGIAGTGEDGGAPTASPLKGVPKVVKVVDPKTGLLMRERRGVEGDFLKQRNVTQLLRFPAREPDVVVEHHRGGLGYSKPMDGLARDVERSDKFWTEKPQRWFADPNGKPIKVQLVGDGGGSAQARAVEHAAAAAALASGGAPAQQRSGYRSQLQANREALAAMKAQAAAHVAARSHR